MKAQSLLHNYKILLNSEKEITYRTKKKTAKLKDKISSSFKPFVVCLGPRIHVGMDEMYEKFKNLLMLL